MENKIKKELTELYEEAEKQVGENPSADQIIVVKTAKDNIHYLVHNISNGGSDDEKSFVKKLSDEGDSEIKYIVGMWNNYGVEITSMNFRKHLLEANPKNAEALMLLQGEGQLIVKKLEQTMPAK